MTEIPLPSEWGKLSAGYTRYELMHRVHEIAKISPNEFYNRIDIQGFEDFIGDLRLQNAENYVGMILFDDEIEAVGDFCSEFLEIYKFGGQARIDNIEQLIDSATTLFVQMSKHGEIEIP